MKRYVWSGLLVLLLASSTNVAALAQSGQAAPAQAVVTGVRAEVLFWLQDAEDKLVRLAQAIPQEKYTWRPGEGVRSVSEVFLHVTNGNYRPLTALGVPYPAGVTWQGIETSTTDKVKIIERVKASFAHVREVVMKMSDADLVKSVKFFGDRTQRDILLLVVTHAHEHLGQMIAYTRMNGIVPPWTEERQQQQRQQPTKKAPSQD